MKLIKLYLRFGIGIGFLSAVADRFGFWPQKISAWGNWKNFLKSTQELNPFIPESFVPIFGVIATSAELIFGLCLLIGFKTQLFSKLSGVLLLIFALAITFSSGIKGAFDYSVFAASAGAFALATMKTKFLEIDSLFSK